MKNIAVFSGNRAEFGILFPIIAELSNYYSLDIVLSGAHVLSQWNTADDVKKQLDDANIKYNLFQIGLKERENTYAHSLGTVYEWGLKYYQGNSIDYGIVLGDRVETFGFALATFYSRVPLIHFCGGDIVEVSNFDTNVRHSITKIANYHMVTSDLSRKVILQLGEEDNRVKNIGNPSFDYERMGYLTKKDSLCKKYNILSDDIIGILTFHPSASRTIDENLADFMEVYNGALESNLSKIFITYPNNDPGHEKIVRFIKDIKENQRIMIVKSFGTCNYLGMMSCFDVILIGNSSSGLLETPYYMVPVINIGDRQSGRIRSNNVFDCKINDTEIMCLLNKVLSEYKELKESFFGKRFVFGDGRAALKVVEFLQSIEGLTCEEKLFKKFVLR